MITCVSPSFYKPKQNLQQKKQWSPACETAAKEAQRKLQAVQDKSKPRQVPRPQRNTKPRPVPRNSNPVLKSIQQTHRIKLGNTGQGWTRNAGFTVRCRLCRNQGETAQDCFQSRNNGAPEDVRNRDTG